MERGINPGKDLLSLSRLYRTIRDMRPTLADASTPKAGLLVGVAAWMAGVPCRIYTVRGLRMETATGLTRLVLRVAERISCACAHRVVCVSLSLRERVVELNLAPRKKTVVLGKGSSGIDLERFTPRKHDRAEVEFLCYRLGIPRGVPVLGYVGRLVKDKGIRQLVRAFDQLRTSYPNLHLLLVGEFESLDPVDEETRLYIESTPNVIRTGFVADTAPFYKLMDILAFPTHREGFGQVSLEAQASGVPVVTTNATGAIDSILPGVTGLLTPVGDSNALACAIGQLLADGSLRSRMGRAGRNWMERDFRPEVIWRAQSALYEGLIAEKCSMQPATASDRITKRVFDLGFALFALVLFSPLFVLVAVLVRLAFGSPILFRQVRPGLNAKPFQLLKFRTMTDARGSDGKLLADEDRLTRLGRFLRSTSLDELPELVNVIRGEMSLVGPRPLLPQYLERYTGEQMRRHSVRPGITGWAQVNGRNSVDWEQRFRQDLWYLDHQSLLLDLRILLKTVVQVFKREGISQAGHATMPEFLGVQAGREKGRA
jgi:lipopolysaccharide/colanic/teichoic acid biosynthesis glycosyltransferase/glycosyltransferase involved in cell wall biosynthesis